MASGLPTLLSVALQELLAEETGIELEKDENEKAVEDKHDEEAGEEVTFDRCFYIYGGPEHLEVC